MQKVLTKHTIQISKTLDAQLERACKVLGVSKKNLVLFLISNSYDELLEEKEETRRRLIKGALENYKKRMEKSEQNRADYRKRKRQDAEETRQVDKEKCELPDLCFEIGDFVDWWLEEWSKEYPFSKKELIIALIEHSIYIIDILLAGYKDTKRQTDDAKYTFEKDKRHFLDCIGISQKDFSRLSEAVVLYMLFKNSAVSVRAMTSYGCNTYIVKEEETEEVVEGTEKKEQKATSIIVDCRFLDEKRKYKPRKKSTSDD